jgi:hypothetical protein
MPMLELPPAYSLVTMRDTTDPFAYACRRAAAASAGTFVLAERSDRLEFAVVLEPDEKLASARRAFFAGMNALANSIASHCPPEKPIDFDWPDRLRFNRALIGGGRLGWPEECPEDRIPEWIVFSATVIAAKVETGDPGLVPMFTSLEEEGFETTAMQAIAESFARHLMLAFDLWHERGFDAISATYIDRLTRELAMKRLSIDVNGDLISRDEGSLAQRLPLLPALQTSTWRDLLA